VVLDEGAHGGGAVRGRNFDGASGEGCHGGAGVGPKNAKA
jgi:hypothetical protein